MKLKKAKLSLLVCAGLVLASGCHGKKDPDPSNFKSALNDYYNTHPECIWANPLKLPAQADTSNDSQTKEYDALTDAGLLKRSTEEKKRFLIGSKPVNNYDLSDKGRTFWTGDATQPGYGNFCYGHRDVQAVDNFTTAPNQNGANTATVSYHYGLASVPEWAKSPQVQVAFPKIQASITEPQVASSKLVQTQEGWKVAKD